MTEMDFRLVLRLETRDKLRKINRDYNITYASVAS